MAEDKTGGRPVADLTFEQALAELEEVVARLESGAASLEESITLYARGAELRGHCEAKLKSAEERVDRIVRGPEGALATEPLDDA